MSRCFSVAFAAGFLCIAFAVAPATAKDTDVIEAESLAHTPYQSTKVTCDMITESCVINFDAVPSKKRLVVLDASCGFSMLGGASNIVLVTLAPSTANTPIHYLPIQFKQHNAGSNVDNYAFDVSLAMAFNAPQIPRITIYADGAEGFFGGNCTLTGYLATP